MVNHLLAIDDVKEDFQQILNWAIEFKRLWKQGDEVALNFMPLDTMTIGSIYEKPSTRTRVSFEVGIHRLGGNALTLLKNDIQLGKSETVGDTSQVLSRFLGGMTYRCFGHDDVTELAKYATVPVLNALSAKHHPCQAAADLMTVMEHFTDRENLVVSWVGDGNNVLHDLMLACTMLGIDFRYAVPEGYEPAEDVVERSMSYANEHGSELTRTIDPKEAVKDAHVVYTDVFISMGEEHLEDKMKSFSGYQVNEEMVSGMDDEWRFMHCLPAHRGDEVTDWVMEHLEDKMKSFSGYQVNEEMVSGMDDEWRFMHCLPAHRGDEVTDWVMDHEHSIVFDQAENRMWAQMSLLCYFIAPEAWDAMGEFMGLV